MGLGSAELEFGLGLVLEVMSVLAHNNLDYGLALCLDFRVRVTPTLQRGTFKVGVMIYWYYSDLDRVLIAFGFSILVGFRNRVVFKF